MEIPTVCPMKPTCTFLSGYDDPIKGKEVLDSSDVPPVVSIETGHMTYDEYDVAINEVFRFCKRNRDCQLVRLEEALKDFNHE